jgi:excinuclease ABC subunit B
VLVGINLLREGLDLPEVSLVAILDADKEGFLRDARSLIQTIGRAARNVNGTAIMYADRITDSMKVCLDETGRRRTLQLAHNETHGITPETIRKSVEEIEFTTRVADARGEPAAKVAESKASYADEVNREEYMKILEEEMRQAAEAMDFERAAVLRDQLFELKAEVDGSAGKGKPRRRSLAEELRAAAESGR